MTDATRDVVGSIWTYLSVPPGQSDASNQNPTLERPAGRIEALKTRKGG